MEQLVVPALAGVCLIVSLIADRERTRRALLIAWRRLLGLLPALLLLVAAVSVVVSFLPPQTMAAALSGGCRRRSLKSHFSV